MNKKFPILLLETLLVALPVWAIIEGHSKTSDAKRCSNEIEKLKLCVKNSKVIVAAGEPVRLELSWINTSEADRRLGNRRSKYTIKVNNQSGVQLIPVFEQRFIDEQKRTQGFGEEKGIILETQGGSDRGLLALANDIEKDAITLTDMKYDYDLTIKGKYKVIVERTVPNSSGHGKSTFTLDGIEIEVK